MIGDEDDDYFKDFAKWYSENAPIEPPTFTISSGITTNIPAGLPSTLGYEDFMKAVQELPVINPNEIGWKFNANYAPLTKDWITSDWIGGFTNKKLDEEIFIDITNEVEREEFIA